MVGVLVLDALIPGVGISDSLPQLGQPCESGGKFASRAFGAADQD
ncbi:MAG TPA: hypothetical protein VGH37_06715 [Candidatus Acidoferrum sp.]|jgi:hypothetical protein